MSDLPSFHYFQVVCPISQYVLTLAAYCSRRGLAVIMNMDYPLLQSLFGCLHRKTTFPLTPIRRIGNISSPAAECKAQTYIACLECGKELPYDWDKMRRIKIAYHTRSFLAFRRLAAQLRLTSAS
jgi:hypothetical protein